MSKRATDKPAKSKYNQQTIQVKGASMACLKRIRELVKAECEQSGAVVAFGPPSPSCGGPGDPC